MNLLGKTKNEFKIEPLAYPNTETFLQRCANIYAGKPEWLNPDKNITTVNFAKSVCSEIARLALLGTSITVDGSGRAEWMKEQVDKLFATIRQRLENGCAFGTIIVKPSDANATLDVYFPDDFIVTDYQNGKIIGVVFRNVIFDSKKKKYYVRLEWQRFEGDKYIITNRCYLSNAPTGDGESVPIDSTPWAGLAEEVEAANVEQPLFGVFKTPNANNIDLRSPLSLPVFADALEELRALDIAFSRNAKEIEDSKRIVLLDSDSMLMGNGAAKGTLSPNALTRTREALDLPDYVRNVRGDGAAMFYQEINPTLQTETRQSGINALLSQIGFKCGFSNGYFVFNEKTGMITATQVESDDRRTIQLIDDVREGLKHCVDGVCYALDKFADAYNLAPVGAYEITNNFEDITYNFEEDRARVWGQVIAGKFPYWRYLVKFEGYSEDEAKEIVSETEIAQTLYDTLKDA